VVAVVVLLARRTRAAVGTCWAVALVALLVGLGLGAVRLDLGPVTVPATTAPVVALVVGAAVTAAVLGALALAPRGARTGGAAVVAVALAAGTLGGLVWALGAGDGELGDGAVDEIPAYMTSSALEGPERGVLVVTGDLERGLDYTVRRGDGSTVGEAEVELATTPDDTASAAVATLLGRPDAAAVAAVGDLGVEYVVLPAPADGRVAAGLDAVDGLVQASAEDRSTRAWRLDAEPRPGAVDGPGSWTHTALVVAQLLALLVVLVLCGPSRREAS